jgi:hypothetical protein
MMKRPVYAMLLVASTAGATSVNKDAPLPPCEVAGPRRIAFGARTMLVAEPLYDKARPLGASCNEKHSVVFERNAFTVLPGSEALGTSHTVEAKALFRQEIPLNQKKQGVSAWVLEGDSLHFMTADGGYWQTDLTGRGVLGLWLKELQGGSRFSMSHSKGVALIAQENPNGNCLVAVEAASGLSVKPFKFDSCNGARVDGDLFWTDGRVFSVTVQNGAAGTAITPLPQ